MHYVICYDTGNDPQREKIAATLRRHGCERVQKSVFVAAFMDAKDLKALHAALDRLFQRLPLSAADGLFIVPLPAEAVPKIKHWGNNSVIPILEKERLKTIL